MEMTQEQAPSGRRWSATGVIKKVFAGTREPYGFLRLLTPFEFRGREAAFFYTDIALPQAELQYVQPGLTMEFSMIEKPKDHMQSPVPFKAEQIKPMDPVELQGGVVRGPRDNGKGIIVSLDYSSTNVRVTAASWSELCTAETNHTPLLPGDTVIVRLYWQEVLQAAKEKRPPVGDIVTRLPTLPRRSRRRSVSNKHRYLRDPSELDEPAKSLTTSDDTSTPVGTGSETNARDRTADQQVQLQSLPIESKGADAEPVSDSDELKTVNDAAVVGQIDRASSAKIGKPNEGGCQLNARTTTEYHETQCGEGGGGQRESRKCQADRGGGGGAAIERRRTRSCGGGLTQQVLLNQAFFADDLMRPHHDHSDAVDEGHVCSRMRVSSPLLEPACAPQFHQYHPPGAFIPYEGGYNMPIVAQAGMWSQWSQTAVRGQHDPLPSRMSLKDFLISGGKLL